LALRDHFESSGAWLFRWRSYLPVMLFGIVLFGMRDFDYPAETHSGPAAWAYLCLGVGLAGLVVRALTCGCAYPSTSGRVTAEQQAESLNSTGMYSIVRHPLYLGNYLMWLSGALLTRTVWVPLVITLIFWIYYERIMAAEEAFLARKFGATFALWARATPAFLPAVSRWKKPACRFNLRRVLRRERSSVLGLAATFVAFDLIVGSVARSALHLDRAWLILLGGALLYYVAMSVEKKYAVRREMRTAARVAPVQSSLPARAARRKAAP
jgi:protein-S-isoprenylcysteine O-methyltransferase Ste14